MIKKMGLAVCLWMLIAVNAQAQCPYYADGQSGDFCYTVSENTATIAGYVGTSPDIVIPTIIDSMPVTNIGEEAFYDYSWLTSVIIPDSVTTIEWAAFRNCSGLISVTIPDSVISIGNNVFDGCTGLTDIYVDDANTIYSSDNGVLYNEDKTVLVRYPGGKPGGFTVPDGVTGIAHGAFSYCNCLTRITMPDTVTSIGNYSFDGCSMLTSVTIPDSVSSIGISAFTNCPSLSKAYFLGNAPFLGGEVFFETAPDFTICYRAEAAGFTTPVWNPTPENSYPAEPCDCSIDSDCAEDHECSDGLCMLPIAQPGFGKWTWMSGADTTWQAAIYGTKGVPDAANVPGAREDSVSWIDNFGNVWLFGGCGMGISGEVGVLNELWHYNISSGQWTWMSGSDTVDHHGVYGTRGVPDPANVPGARWGSVSWTDSTGSLWLFGGFGLDNYPGSGFELNDLWRYDPDTNMWTWISGSEIRGQDGIYGTKGIPDPDNVPGARVGSVSWTDSSGNLWLFGGQGYPEIYTLCPRCTMKLNDLWRYDPDSNMWTWISGSNTNAEFGIYGTKGEPDTANVPGCRWRSISWTDSSGNLWLFGGSGNAVANDGGDLNDLWRYNLSTGQWTWMSGSDTANQEAVYGTRGVPATDNVPGARDGSVSWTDGSGNLWLFGGSYGAANDLWRYSLATGQWTWMSGSGTDYQIGVYGTKGIPDAANMPGARDNSISWTDSSGNLWLFGGREDGMSSPFNDLWRYEIAQECNDENDCQEGESCVEGVCESIQDAPPAIDAGPYVAAGNWPLLSASSESPTYFKQNSGLLWTFSDDYAACGEACTHVAEYQALGANTWTSLTVGTDPSGEWYAYAELPINALQNATTYAFRFTVTDCAGQSTQSGTYYFRVAVTDTPPVIEAGPFLAAGSWPIVPTSASRAFVLNQNYAVLWTFSDDYASCSGLCTHRARYKEVDAVSWTFTPVSTDPDAEWYAYTTLPIENLEPGTYQFYFDVRDCAGQRTYAPKVYYFKVE